MVQVDVDLSHLKQFGPLMPEVQTRGMQLTALDMINKLQRNSPVDQGLLKQWFVKSQSKDKVVIQSPAFYAVYQNDGTPAHGPKHAQALRWPGKATTFKSASGTVMSRSGGYIFAKHVKGIKGKHFVERSIEQVKPRIENHFKVAIKEVLG